MRLRTFFFVVVMRSAHRMHVIVMSNVCVVRGLGFLCSVSAFPVYEIVKVTVSACCYAG